MSGTRPIRGPVFGLDGGGTSTRLRIADSENHTLFECRGEGVNPNATSPELVSERLEVLFAEAFRETGLESDSFKAGCLGVAGADRPAERAELESILRGKVGLSCPIRIVSDPDIALVGGLKRLDGYLLIAGTGSIAIARLPDGTRFRSGGLGHYLGDEGSSFFIGFQAIRRSLRSLENRDIATTMLEPLLNHFGLRDPSEFIALVYRRFDKALVATAAELVERYRASGDALAQDIMAEARDELVALVGSVHAKAVGRIDDPALVLWGGLLEYNAWLRDGVAAGVARVCPVMRVTKPLESAAYGACMLALNLSRA